MATQPNCCHEPVLQALLVTSSSPDGEVILERCRNCRTFWRVTAQERIKVDGGEDYRRRSFERLSDEEANDVLFDGHK
jgi:hypothetical protein